MLRVMVATLVPLALPQCQVSVRKWCGVEYSAIHCVSRRIPRTHARVVSCATNVYDAYAYALSRGFLSQNEVTCWCLHSRIFFRSSTFGSNSFETGMDELGKCVWNERYMVMQARS